MSSVDASSLPDDGLGQATRFLGAVFGAVSAVGGIMVILSYLLFPPLRTAGRQLVCWLSLADLLQALFFVASAAAGPSPTSGDCWWIGLFGIFSALSTFLWTFCISVFVFVSVARIGLSQMGSKESLLAKEQQRNRWLFFIFHLVSWGYPLFACILVATQVSTLNSPDATWCFVPSHYQVLRLVSIYIPLIVCWFFTAIMYAAAMMKLRAVRRYQGETGRALHGEVQTKLILIPLIFVFMRLPDLIYRLAEMSKLEIWFLLPLMSIGNSSQGIVDCLIYVVFTGRARELFMLGCKLRHQSVNAGYQSLGD